MTKLINHMYARVAAEIAQHVGKGLHLTINRHMTWTRPPLSGSPPAVAGEEAIRALRSAQLSKHLLLIARILGNWPGDAGERDALAAALDTVRRASPATFAEVIGAPLVGTWTAIANRALEQGALAWEDAAHLGALVLVASAAAGVDGPPGRVPPPRERPSPDYWLDLIGGSFAARGTTPGQNHRRRHGWTPLKLRAQLRSSGRTPPGSQEICQSSSDHPLSLVTEIEADAEVDWGATRRRAALRLRPAQRSPPRSPSPAPPR